ncbi:sulfatase-like hydrolase/transferase [Rubritalea spongiae]|uniref:Sulfatase-like hydrolase/transferase n=1 Tax=Rubritalea spongiae TaxID=430797 RepID=A0ABW5DZE0_9BACT
MKPIHALLWRSTLCCASLITALPAHAAISAGNSIGIDFGNNTSPNPPHWNVLDSPGDDIAVDSVISTMGTILTGISFTTEINGTSGDNADSTVSASHPSIPTNAQEDWWFENANAGAFTFTFSGLDDGFEYALTIGANRTGANATQQANGSTRWEVNGNAITTVVDDPETAYVTFSGLSSSGGVLTITSADNDGNTVGAVSALLLTAIDPAPVSQESIKIDFGTTPPASTHWNQFAMESATTSLPNLVRSSDGSATSVGISISGISGNGANHLAGSGSDDATIYADHIFAQNESPDDTLTVTISGLDDSKTYDLSGGFLRNSASFEHQWTVGSDIRSNSYDGTNVDGYEDFTGITPTAGEIVLTISDISTSDNWASIAELTISAESFDDAPPQAFTQNLRTEPGSPLEITLTGSGSDLVYTIESDPGNGVLTGSGQTWSYSPNGDFSGTDAFTFSVTDGDNGSEIVTVTITVAEKGPNFILFLTDDQGYNDLGVYGSPHILTPRIDAMAAEGIRFTSGYVPMPVCGPCRAGILTGCYPIRIAEHNNEKHHHTEPHAEEIMIPELLKNAGYTSALIGKWHNSGEGSRASSFNPGRGPIDQGFDYFYGTPSHNGVRAVDTGTNVQTAIVRADITGSAHADSDLTQSEADQMIYNYTHEAMDFMENAHNANQPFFLKLAHNMPHVSLATRQSYRDSAAARGLDVYTAVVEELDWSMGAILDKLDELGIEEDTFIIYSSDNGPWTQSNLEGYYGSAFPLRGSKMRSLEGGPRVPFIVRWPGTITPNVVSDEIVTLMDLFPTFMDYANVLIPDDLEIDGKNIRGLIEGTETESPHEYYYYYVYTQLAAIRDTRWKLTLPRRNNPASAWMAFWRGWQDRVDEVELYDLDTDPEETTNLAAQYPEIVQRLLEQVEIARSELGDKDRIGSGARFFDDPATRRPDITDYNNNATKPYVDEPLTGLPISVKTKKDSAWVSYDEPGVFSSVELVWAYEDQGQADSTTWATAAGGGSANLGAVTDQDPIGHEITGLNPFRQYIYRFILTGASGTRWSIPAPIQPERETESAYTIGIDFSNGGNTEGSGAEPNWNSIAGNTTLTEVYDAQTGTILPGVTIQTTGINTGEMTASNLGFGEAEYGNYLDTPFSDLSANDGVSTASGSIQVQLSGLNDLYCYDIQLLAMPETNTSLTNLTITAGGSSQTRTYASFRPYINNDQAPFTNSDFVLSNPFYSRPIIVPASFEDLSTDGSGNLTITLSDDEAIPLNAIHITAKHTQSLHEITAGSNVRFWLNQVPEGRRFEMEQSSDLETWVPVDPAQQLDAPSDTPLEHPIDLAEPKMFFRLQENPQ